MTAPRVTGDVFLDLYNMHKKFGFHEQKFDKKALQHRVDFLQEELDEIRVAVHTRDAHGVLDGLIDLIVVAAGTIDLSRANGHEAWKRVMDANNSKEVGFNKTRPNSEGVDLVKPEGWEAPNLEMLWGNLLSVLFEDHELNLPDPFGEKIPISRSPFYEPKIPQEFEKDRAAVQVLEDCISLMKLKAQDYTSSNSSVKPAQYYPNGIDDLIYMIDVLKRLRMTSVLDNMKAGGKPNFDSLIDILEDRIVYLALAIEYVRGEMSGQQVDHDLWNRKVSKIIGEAQDD